MGAESEFSHSKAFYEQTVGEPWREGKKPEKGQIKGVGGEQYEHNTDRGRSRGV